MNKAMLQEMLVLQCGINAQVHPQWPTQKFPWHLAIITEASEGIEHLSFKWWKQGEINLEQAQLEAVDVWHFGMSLLLEQMGSVTQAANFIMMECDLYTPQDNPDPINAFTDVVSIAASNKEFSTIAFSNLLESLNMSWPDLYLWYIGKNALNKLRQDYGYQTGEYIKTWHGREDKEFLAEILARESASDGLFDRVYKQLTFAYPSTAKELH